MRIARLLLDGKERFALVDSKGEFARLSSSLSLFSVSEANSLGETINLADASFLAPTSASKIICIGLNYKPHVEELHGKKLLNDLPTEPVIFLKPPSSLIGHRQAIILPNLPEGFGRVDYEAELAVVIGKNCKDVPVSSAKNFIFGYTCLTDVTARDLQKKDTQWTRAKSFDTFAPCGPWIDTDGDFSDSPISCKLNGKIVQSARTSELIFPVPKLVSFISSVMTLLPGDIISTGTPAGVGPMKRGDTVEISVGGLGSILNHVK